MLVQAVAFLTRSLLTSGLSGSLPNANQNYGIDPNADQFRSMPIRKNPYCGLEKNKQSRNNPKQSVIFKNPQCPDIIWDELFL